MKVLVTGASGFIGKNMMAFLSKQPEWQVDGWDWDPNDFPDVRPYDWVVHLGAIADMTETDVDKVLQQNLEFSQRLFNECNKHGVHLQYASSSSVYGNTKDTSEYAPCYPQTPYAWSKYLFDLMLSTNGANKQRKTATSKYGKTQNISIEIGLG